MARIQVYCIILISAITILILNYTFLYYTDSFYSLKLLRDGTDNPDIREHLEDEHTLKTDIKIQVENGLIAPEDDRKKKDIRNPVPKVVIGILSNSNYTCLRDTQRALFVRAAKEYRQLDIKVFFLLDQPSPELDKEQNLHKDIVYLNVTEHGWNVNFAKKLYNWYKIAVEKFPDAMMIGRMDDDVFVCTPQIFDRLNEVKNPLLYYGYSLVGVNHLDDMFLFMGIEIAKRIAKKKMCREERTEACLENGNAVKNLPKWMSGYSDAVIIDEAKSGKMVYYTTRGKGGRLRMKEMYSYIKHDFCKNYILFHKASPQHMYELNKNNEILLNDASRWKVSDREIENLRHCEVDNYELKGNEDLLKSN